MALWACGFPFAIALKGNKKEKHRYIVALKRADNGDFIPYSALIAKRGVETFKEFDKNLVIAGIKSLIG